MEGRPILKDQYLLIEGVANKPSSMTDEDWNKLDKKSIATIRQYLAKKVYFNVAEEKTSKALWKKLHDLYEKTQHQTKFFG